MGVGAEHGLSLPICKMLLGMHSEPGHPGSFGEVWETDASAFSPRTLSVRSFFWTRSGVCVDWSSPRSHQHRTGLHLRTKPTPGSLGCRTHTGKLGLLEPLSPLRCLISPWASPLYSLVGPDELDSCFLVHQRIPVDTFYNY